MCNRAEKTVNSHSTTIISKSRQYDAPAEQVFAVSPDAKQLAAPTGENALLVENAKVVRPFYD